MSKIAIWGGVECTVNRVGDQYYDQLERSGHAARLSDLALFAELVAERCPWVKDFSPINEPLTTARFSGLYGHWYSHERNVLSFAKALIHQCKATVLAMNAIREVIPDARLVQTEDFGKTHSMEKLQYQADFENERRFITFDLLTGRPKEGDSMWQYLISLGISKEEILWFSEHPCPPDVLGINYYVTSERFLDDRVSLYTPEQIGGNGEHTYADVEAVRVRAEGIDGPEILFREVWNRYHLPIAITEVHVGCSREEQLRWFMGIYQAAQKLVKQKVNIVALTAWNLLGCYDWNHLLTKQTDHYESGVFDLRFADGPRMTALAHMIKSLTETGTYHHAALPGKGWWDRPTRLLYPPTGKEQVVDDTVEASDAKPIMIIGASGTLATAFKHLAYERGLPCVSLGRDALNIFDEVSILVSVI